MRKSSLYLVVLVAALTLGSCGGNKKNVKKELSELPKPSMDLNAADTAEVVSLTNQFLDRLRAEKFDEAVGMIFFLNGDSIEVLSNDRARGQKALLERCKGVRYDVDYFVFSEEKDNIVKYTVTMFEKDANDPRPNTTSFYLKPIRRDGKWFLTMADSMSDTNQLNGTRIQN